MSIFSFLSTLSSFIFNAMPPRSFGHFSLGFYSSINFACLFTFFCYLKISVSRDSDLAVFFVSSILPFCTMLPVPGPEFPVSHARCMQVMSDFISR
jgi:hypothetical protein